VALTAARSTSPIPPPWRRGRGERRRTSIVNCAAFNDVDGAEDPPRAGAALQRASRSAAWRLAAEAAGARSSTTAPDFVFGRGRARQPLYRDDAPAPRSTVLRRRKLMGEWFALDCAARVRARGSRACSARPRGGRAARGTLDPIVGGPRAGREVRVFTDPRGVAWLHARHSPRRPAILVASGAAPGIYHCVNDGEATWEQVAREAARVLGRRAGAAADDLGPGRC
jgi:dTDP-4-dehydrorhamnose reductase